VPFSANNTSLPSTTYSTYCILKKLFLFQKSRRTVELRFCELLSFLSCTYVKSVVGNMVSEMLSISKTAITASISIRNRVLFIVVTKLLAFLWDAKVHHCVHKTSPSWTTRIYSTPSYRIYLISILILLIFASYLGKCRIQISFRRPYVSPSKYWNNNFS
jgi:hypothetical protein